MTKASVDSNPQTMSPRSARGGRRPDSFAGGERRDSTRQITGGPVWWKGQDNRQFQQGWLIERSSDGAAFLTRGETTPGEGSNVQVSTSDPTDVGFRVEEGVVTRMTHVHADLYLIAARFDATHLC